MRMPAACFGCLALLLVVPACQTQPPADPPPPPSPNLAGIPADSPAFLCPADARLYIQVNQMSRWRVSRQNDPLIEQFWKSIEGVRPPGLWAGAAANLGISEEAFADRYFGDSFAVIGRGGVTGSPFVVATRVKAADLATLPAAMHLKPASWKGMPAGFKTYLTEKAEVYAAIHEGEGDSTRDGWLLLAAIKNEAYFKEVLAFAGARLPDKASPVCPDTVSVWHGQFAAPGEMPVEASSCAQHGHAATSSGLPVPHRDCHEGGAGGGSNAATSSTHDNNEHQLISQSRPSPSPSLGGRGTNARSPQPASHTLPQNADFQSLLVKLPPQHDVLLYTVDGRKGRHAVSLALDGKSMTAQYVGRIEKIDELYQQFDQAPAAADFGLLPATAISAATVNLIKKDDKGLALLNLFVFPKSVEKDVLPRLDAPIVVFLGQVEGSKLKPDPGIHVPAVGAAIRMKDPAVAHELDRIVAGLHFFASVGQLDLIGGVIGGKTIRNGDLTYRSTDFGKALVRMIKDPDTRRMFELPDAAALTKLTHGRVGPWYVICSQEALFLECAESYANQEKRLTQSPVFKMFPFEAKEGLMLSALTRAPELAALTKEVADYWAKMEAKAAANGEAPDESKKKPDSVGKRIRQPMEWIGDAIKKRDSFYVQVWRDQDGDLAGRLRVVEGK